MNEVLKLAEISDEWGVIMRFLEWLSENRILLCRLNPDLNNRLDQIPETHTDLLYKYFNIDPVKLEQERRKILEAFRNNKVLKDPVGDRK